MSKSRVIQGVVLLLLFCIFGAAALYFQQPTTPVPPTKPSNAYNIRVP